MPKMFIFFRRVMPKNFYVLFELLRYNCFILSMLLFFLSECRLPIRNIFEKFQCFRRSLGKMPQHASSTPRVCVKEVWLAIYAFANFVMFGARECKQEHVSRSFCHFWCAVTVTVCMHRPRMVTSDVDTTRGMRRPGFRPTYVHRPAIVGLNHWICFKRNHISMQEFQYHSKELEIKLFGICNNIVRKKVT